MIVILKMGIAGTISGKVGLKCIKGNFFQHMFCVQGEKGGHERKGGLNF